MKRKISAIMAVCMLIINTLSATIVLGAIPTNELNFTSYSGPSSNNFPTGEYSIGLTNDTGLNSQVLQFQTTTTTTGWPTYKFPTYSAFTGAFVLSFKARISSGGYIAFAFNNNNETGTQAKFLRLEKGKTYISNGSSTEAAVQVTSYTPDVFATYTFAFKTDGTYNAYIDGTSYGSGKLYVANVLTTWGNGVSNLTLRGTNNIAAGMDFRIDDIKLYTNIQTPQISSSTLDGNTLDVNTNISFTFNNLMKKDSVTDQTVTVTKVGDTQPISCTRSLNGDVLTLGLTGLSKGTQYKVAFATGVQDVYGTAIAAQEYTFTTKPKITTVAYTNIVQGSVYEINKAININVNAVDEDGVNGVSVYANGTLVATSTNANFTFAYTPPTEGVVSFSAVVTDINNAQMNVSGISICIAKSESKTVRAYTFDPSPIPASGDTVAVTASLSNTYMDFSTASSYNLVKDNTSVDGGWVLDMNTNVGGGHLVQTNSMATEAGISVIKTRVNIKQGLNTDKVIYLICKNAKAYKVIGFGTDLKVRVADDTTKYSTYQLNNWIDIMLVVNSYTKKYDAYIDNQKMGTYTLPDTVISAATDWSKGPDKIRFCTNNNNGNNDIWRVDYLNVFKQASPAISSVSPANNAVVSDITNRNVTINFSDAMDPSTFNNITLKKGHLKETVASTITKNSNSITFTTTGDLNYNTTYYINISGVKNATGFALGTTEYTFTTSKNPANEPSVINITSPTVNASYIKGETINVNVSAADHEGIAKVTLYCDGVAVGEKTGSDYNFTFDSPNADQFTLLVSVTDNEGDVTESQPISLNNKSIAVRDLKINGNIVNNGTINASVTMSSLNKQNAVLVLVVLKGNKLYSVKSSDIAINANGTCSAVTGNITLPDNLGSDTLVKAFVWDGYTSIKPLSGVVTGN